jgi:uncharacterized BrkB/YihY/UPF0761 family membrane protein
MNPQQARPLVSRRMAALFALALLAILALTAAPLVMAFLAMAIAHWNGCELSSAGASPCIVLGMDIGGALALMALMHWLFLATLPIGLAALAIWIVVALSALAISWFRRRGT